MMEFGAGFVACRMQNLNLIILEKFRVVTGGVISVGDPAEVYVVKVMNELT
jgi:hypothetical protein